MNIKIFEDQLLEYDNIPIPKRMSLKKEIYNIYLKLYKEYVIECHKDYGLIEKIKKAKELHEAETYNIKEDLMFYDYNKKQFSLDIFNTYLKKHEKYPEFEKEYNSQIKYINDSNLRKRIKAKSIANITNMLNQEKKIYLYMEDVLHKLALQKKYKDGLVGCSKIYKQMVEERLIQIAKNIVNKNIEKFPLLICEDTTFDINHDVIADQKIIPPCIYLNDQINKIRCDVLNQIKRNKR